MPDEDSKSWIYAGGLPYELTEGDVICIFSQYGEILEMTLTRDRDTGKSRGFGFLKYEDPRSCELAVDNLNGASIVGRKIKVSFMNKMNPMKARKTTLVAPNEDSTMPLVEDDKIRDKRRREYARSPSPRRSGDHNYDNHRSESRRDRHADSMERDIPRRRYRSPVDGDIREREARKLAEGPKSRSRDEPESRYRENSHHERPHKDHERRYRSPEEKRRENSRSHHESRSSRHNDSTDKHHHHTSEPEAKRSHDRSRDHRRAVDGEETDRKRHKHSKHSRRRDDSVEKRRTHS